MLKNLKKEKVGKVVSNKCDKTITVAVERKTKHPMYGKFVRKTTKFMAHDEKNACSLGEQVKIQETRPLSKKKRWRLISRLDQMQQS